MPRFRARALQILAVGTTERQDDPAAAGNVRLHIRLDARVVHYDVEAATECATAAGYTEGQRNSRNSVALGRCERVGFVGIASETPGVEIRSHFRGMGGCCSHQCCTRQQVSRLD
jgi:hypothetical protein